MGKTYNVALAALQDMLLCYVRAGNRPTPYSWLIARGKDTGFTPEQVRTALHKMAQNGKIGFTTDPIDAGVVVVVEVQA